MYQKYNIYLRGVKLGQLMATDPKSAINKHLYKNGFELNHPLRGKLRAIEVKR